MKTTVVGPPTSDSGRKYWKVIWPAQKAITDTRSSNVNRLANDSFFDGFMFGNLDGGMDRDIYIYIYIHNLIQPVIGCCFLCGWVRVLYLRADTAFWPDWQKIHKRDELRARNRESIVCPVGKSTIWGIWTMARNPILQTTKDWLRPLTAVSKAQSFVQSKLILDKKIQYDYISSL